MDMEGTLTFHFPFQRGPEAPPEMTLVVRRAAPDEWRAGIAVCSLGDQFVKSFGRRVAYHRLMGRPLVVNSALELAHRVEEHLNNLCMNRPHTIGQHTIRDLYKTVDFISKMRVE